MQLKWVEAAIITTTTVLDEAIMECIQFKTIDSEKFNIALERGYLYIESENLEVAQKKYPHKLLDNTQLKAVLAVDKN